VEADRKALQNETTELNVSLERMGREREALAKALDPAALAVDEHRVDQALGAAGRDDAGHLGPGVEQGGGHGHDLRLQLGRARVHVALEHVGVGEQLEGARQEAVVVVVAVVDRARDAPPLPDPVLLARHLRQLRQHLLPVPGLGLQAAMAPVAVAVRVEVDQGRVLGLGLAHRRTLTAARPTSRGTPRTRSEGASARL